jgi:hypothetical protein
MVVVWYIFVVYQYYIKINNYLNKIFVHNNNNHKLNYNKFIKKLIKVIYIKLIKNYLNYYIKFLISF